MKKSVIIVLDDAQIVDLMRILIDNEADDALNFLRIHFKSKVRELLEGG
jgi:hypothetical protein